VSLSYYVSVNVPTSLHTHATSIPALDGTNFSEWFEHVQFTLGVLDLDMALIVDKPDEVTAESIAEQVSHAKAWERSNRLSLMFIKMTIANNIKTSLPPTTNASELLSVVKDRFKSADKSLAGTLMAELTTMKYDGNRGVQQHILNMTDKAAKLGSLGMKVDESFLVQFILNSLPLQFRPFKIHYNTHKDKWNLNELTGMCVQEKVRLRQEGQHSVLAVTQGGIHKKGKYGRGKRFPPRKGHDHGESSQGHRKVFTVKCYFCGRKGHVKKDCNKRKA